VEQKALNSIIDALTKNDENEKKQIGFGAIIEYMSGDEKRVGKVTSYNKLNKKLIVSKAIGKSRAGGFSYSIDDTEEVAQSSITRRLE